MLEWRERPHVRNDVLRSDPRGRNCGCRELHNRLLDLHPRVHCFGHIHASAGITCLNGTTYVNASMVNRRYEIAHQPIELNV